MRRLLYIAILSLCVSCTFWEEATTTELLRPGAAIKTDRTEQVSIYVFDQSDSLIFIEERSTPSTIDSLQIVDGVPEGGYRVVSFVNCKRYRFSKMEVGKSIYRDLSCEMIKTIGDDNKALRTADSVLYGNQQVEASWGFGSRAPVPIVTRQLYYNTSIRIAVEAGVDFWDEVSSFSLELRKAPRSFDYAGLGIDPSVTYEISDFKSGDPDNIVASLRLPRFVDADKVELHAISNGYSLGHVVLAPSKFKVDPASPDPISITVDLDINPRSIEVKIEDWHVGTIQTTQVGN